MRKLIAIILLVAAAAGLVYGILGATDKTVDIHSGDTQGYYDFRDNTYYGTVGWSSAGGLSMAMSDIVKLAKSQRSRQIWTGFGGFVLLGIVGASLLKKRNY